MHAWVGLLFDIFRYFFKNHHILQHLNSETHALLSVILVTEIFPNCAPQDILGIALKRVGSEGILLSQRSIISLEAVVGDVGCGRWGRGKVGTQTPMKMFVMSIMHIKALRRPTIKMINFRKQKQYPFCFLLPTHTVAKGFHSNNY